MALLNEMLCRGVVRIVAEFIGEIVIKGFGYVLVKYGFEAAGIGVGKSFGLGRRWIGVVAGSG